MRRTLQERGLLDIDLSVDGGIDEHIVPQVLRAGANVLVAGSAVFAAADRPAVALRRLREAAAGAQSAQALATPG